LHNGDSLELLTSLDHRALRPKPDKIFKADACVCDPPYGFDFGGSKDWDSFEDERSMTEGVQDAEVFAKFTEKWVRGVMDNLWPGGHVMAFSDSTTLDLLGRGYRLAGLPVVRGFAWLYSSGQVKNPNDTRPGFEPILCGRFMGQMGNLKDLNKLFKATGRGQLHAQVWKEEDGKHPTNVMISEDAVALDEDLARLVAEQKASFFVPKPSPKDRDAYCGDLPEVVKDNRLSHMTSNAKGKVVKDVMAQNFHPTVKPIELMRRLIRLVSRPGGTIIDPFMGSGTCGVAAVLEGRNYVGIEREVDYFKIAQTRIMNALEEYNQQEAA
jgi:site-specific DNA-methyltransferase (adenine-specific)